jgi:hypothetical protein
MYERKRKDRFSKKIDEIIEGRQHTSKRSSPDSQNTEHKQKKKAIDLEIVDDDSSKANNKNTNLESVLEVDENLESMYKYLEVDEINL